MTMAGQSMVTFQHLILLMKPSRRVRPQRCGSYACFKEEMMNNIHDEAKLALLIEIGGYESAEEANAEAE
jgi:hypothetical protein